MSCHKFSNFREKLNIDLNAKVVARVKDVSENGIWTVCVKNGARKENGDCAYGGATVDSRWLFKIYTAMLWDRTNSGKELTPTTTRPG
jgi:hypothetical protein